MKKAVIVSCFNWYDRRLKVVREILQSSYEVEVILSDFSHIKKEYASDNNEVNYIHVRKYKKNISLDRISSHIGFSKKVYEYLKSKKPDLIYALIPPNMVGYYCSKYKKSNSSVKIIYDVIDMWPESFPIDKFSDFFLFKIWKNIRNKSLSESEFVFTECELYQSYLKKYAEGNMETLHLYKEMLDVYSNQVRYSVSREKENTQDRICLGYLGSINNIIDLDGIENLLISLRKEYNVCLKIIGGGERTEEFIARAKKAGADVEYYGKIFDESAKIKILGDCDYGINMMLSSVKVGLTIKSIDYFSYGLPVINNIKGDTWALIDREGIGVNYRDVSDSTKIKPVTSKQRLKVLEIFEKKFTKQVYIKTLKEVFKKQEIID